MSLPITPEPPGFAARAARIARTRPLAPSTRNLFVIAPFDRGLTGFSTDFGSLLASVGQRTNYSPAIDSLAASTAEGGGTIIYSRVLGEDSTPASVTVGGLKVLAATDGEWGNALKLEVVVGSTSGLRRLIVTEDGVPVATSAERATTVELAAAFPAGAPVVTQVVSSTLPPVADPAAFTGGTDDRANIAVSDYVAAAARFQQRQGPGTLLLPGVTSYDVHKALAPWADEQNHIAFLDLAADISDSDAIEHAQSLQADVPDAMKSTSLWGSWAYASPISGDPQRLVPYSAIQAGISSRVERQFGISKAAFGVTRGSSATADRIYRERTDAERHALYVAGINIATDDGQSIATWGHNTLDPDERFVDLHAARVRMWINWQGGTIAKGMLGDGVNADTLASYYAKLDGLLGPLKGNALNDYRIDVDAANTTETMERRELHAGVRVQQTPNADWVDLTVGYAALTEAL